MPTITIQNQPSIGKYSPVPCFFLLPLLGSATAWVQERVEKVLPFTLFHAASLACANFALTYMYPSYHVPWSRTTRIFVAPFIRYKILKGWWQKMLNKTPVFSAPRMLNQFWGEIFQFQFLMHLKQKILHMI